MHYILSIFWNFHYIEATSPKAKHLFLPLIKSITPMSSNSGSIFFLSQYHLLHVPFPIPLNWFVNLEDAVVDGMFFPPQTCKITSAKFGQKERDRNFHLIRFTLSYRPHWWQHCFDSRPEIIYSVAVARCSFLGKAAWECWHFCPWNAWTRHSLRSSWMAWYDWWQAIFLF